MSFVKVQLQQVDSQCKCLGILHLYTALEGSLEEEKSRVKFGALALTREF